jgi:5-(carboxyamino)imidazole ribonucleotide mutase
VISTNDWDVMEDAARHLKDLGVPYEVRALSAHRIPDVLIEWIAALEKRDARCFIADTGSRVDGFLSRHPLEP